MAGRFGFLNARENQRASFDGHFEPFNHDDKLVQNASLLFNKPQIPPARGKNPVKKALFLTFQSTKRAKAGRRERK
jgi:hypothetical protein